MATEFEQSFAERLSNDLVSGKYSDGADAFARGITNCYMASLGYNAPTDIPIYKTSPVTNTQVIIGPATSLSNLKRRDAFYNVIRAYFVEKEISQGKVRIRSLTTDIKQTISLYKKTATEVQNLVKEVQDIDNKLEELKKDIQAIKPAVKQYVEEKKQAIKDAFNEVEAVINRAKEVKRTTNINTFDYEALLSTELADVKALLSLKIEPSLSIADIQETVQTLMSFLTKSQTTLKKYKNTFSKEANLKVYLMKKVKEVINQVLNILNAIINPESFKNFWRDLLRVPNGKRIAMIMLKFIEKNATLKEKQKELLIKLEVKNKKIKDSIERKLENLQSIFDKTLEDQETKIKQLTSTEGIKLDPAILQAILGKPIEPPPPTNDKWAKRAVKAVKGELEYYRAKTKRTAKRVQHYKLMQKRILELQRKIGSIVLGIRALLRESINDVQKVKLKYAEIKGIAEESTSAEAKQARSQAFKEYKDSLSLQNIEQANAKLMETFGENDVLVQGAVLSFQKLFSLNTQQIAAFFRLKTNKANNIVNTISEILEIDIPIITELWKIRKISSIEGYNIQVQDILSYEKAYREKGRSFAVDEFGDDINLVEKFANRQSKPMREYRYADVLNRLRKASKKIKNLQENIEIGLNIETNKITERSKEADALQTYIDQVLDINPIGRDIQNVKRKQEQQIATAKFRAMKLKKIAQQTRIAYALGLKVPKILSKVFTDPLNKTPISDNESDLKDVINAYLLLQVERGKMTSAESVEQKTEYLAKIADFKAYEKIVDFLFDLIDSAKGYKDDLSNKGFQGLLERAYADTLKNKVDNTSERTRVLFKTTIDIITGAAQPLNLQTIAKLPSELRTQANLAYALVKAETNAFKALQGKAKRIGSFIPKGTRDPVLRFVRAELQLGPGHFFTAVLKAIEGFVKRFTDFLAKLLNPALEFLKLKSKEVRENIQSEAVIAANAKIESEVNLDSRIMSFIFGLAAKVFWTGISWTNPVGTKFIVTNVGRFAPVMSALITGTEKTFAEEMAWGFDTQLSKMSGIAIPAPATGIPPFRWQGYMGKQEYVEGY